LFPLLPEGSLNGLVPSSTSPNFSRSLRDHAAMVI
jgi:hypothetical protein